MRFETMCRAILVAAGVCVAGSAGAQQGWPARPVRMVVPFPAGGTADLLGRVVGQRLAQQYGQQVVVENRSGSSGHVGAEVVARSAPDGHTIAVGTIGIHAAHAIYSKLSYDPAKELLAVLMLAEIPNVLVVHPSLPVRTTREFIALAKGRPGGLNYGSAGSGSSTHIIAELFLLEAKLKLNHVPYRGSAPAMQDLMGGQIECMFENLPSGLGPIQSGRVRAVAVTSGARSPSLPNVPTVAESGLPGYEATAWFTLFAPAKLPTELARRLNADVDGILRSKDMEGRWKDLGVTPLGGSIEHAAKFIAAETVQWNRVIKAAAIRE